MRLLLAKKEEEGICKQTAFQCNGASILLEGVIRR